MDFPYGQLIDAPKWFTPPEQWPEFNALTHPPTICAKEEVGKNPKGVRWSLWPLTFEEYVSDQEPDLAASTIGNLARNRLVTWKRIGRTDTPLGWWMGKSPWRIDGVYNLKENPHYTTDWSQTERRHQHKWATLVAQQKYRIEEISIDEFANAYTKSIVAKKFGTELLLLTKRKHATASTQNLVLYGVRDIESHTIIAGTAVIYSPTYKGSTCESRFMLPAARGTHAMTGLMDHWFAESKKRGSVFLVFMYFWYPGAPKKWSGFSEFKSHFCKHYIAYPPELTRFVRGKLF